MMPMAPKAGMPPRTPTNTARAEIRARPEISIGRNTLSTPASMSPQASMKIAKPQRPS